MSEKPGNHKKFSRRRFIAGSGATFAGLAVGGPIAEMILRRRAPILRSASSKRKMIIIGMDGMDPNFVRQFAREGILPNFTKLMGPSRFTELQTTMPPQSPVAWSSFITGTNPGGHGIFDFVHRDPATFSPYLSTTRTSGSSHAIEVGKWSLPLSPGNIDLMRKGPAFWNVLAENGIPTTVFQIPANFPVEAGPNDNLKAISGMGTPDLLGNYGIFTLFSDGLIPGSDKFEGGRVERVRVINNTVKATLRGPKNSFRTDGEPIEIPLVVNRDPTNSAIKISIQGHDIILKEGEWSEWTPLKFEMVPMFASLAGMVRFYAQQIYPRFRLYASPIDIDPMEPSVPICTPASYSAEVSQAVGRFYTQGFPADTKALSTGVFSSAEFFEQSKFVLGESMRNFEFELDRFKEGCFYFYFSSIDQNSHMLMRCMQPDHPLYEPNAPQEVKEAIRWYYKQMDKALELALRKVDSDTTLIALSDHGFAPFEREMHLSSWLVDNGYTTIDQGARGHDGGFFTGVDWARSKAYAFGLNGIYINMDGRETNGSVPPAEVSALKQEIIAKLSQVRDPLSGKLVCKGVYDSLNVYSGPYTALAPDILVAYERGFRISDKAAFGGFPTEQFGNRTDKWASDHCMDPSLVPGILLTNRDITQSKPALWDMAPTILNEFGLPVPKEMEGKAVI